VPLQIPASLAANCQKSPERKAWLDQLPATIELLSQKWSLQLSPAFDTSDVTASYVAPARRSDDTAAILKIGMPHFEALHEIDGLRFWSGNPTVYLFEADAEHNAMLLERCEPGTALRNLPLPEQDKIIAALLHRLWRTPPKPNPFRPLSALTAYWSEQTLSQKPDWPDEALVREGLRFFHDLPRNAPAQVLLATDLHAGNILRAQREPWLAIDPKPFLGDPAYDATQHLFNDFEFLCSNPIERIRRFADLLDVDRDRVRLWTFARLAAEPRDDWRDLATIQLARTLVQVPLSRNPSNPI
jgi:streptomycin 6-kinase